MKELTLDNFLPMSDALVAGAVSDAADVANVDYSFLQGVSMANAENRIFGYVRTVSVAEISTMDENLSAGLGFLETLNEGEVLLVRGSSKFAYFGEMMGRLSERLGLGGAVILGAARDSAFLRRSTFGVASSSFCPVDIKGRGRVGGFDESFETDGFEVGSGDLLFADSDGVLVIKKAGLASFFTSLREVLSNEEALLRRINNGESVTEILLHHKSF
jgi:regulator of RNase E activity RraA